MTNQDLPIVSTSSESTAGGCGCGGCGCGGGAADAQATADAPVAGEIVGTYAVTGMTCGHCANAVREELGAVPGVSDVQVDLVAGGTSTVRVTSTRPLEQAEVEEALAEAGDYSLA